MSEAITGVFFGLVTGACAAPVWVMLSLPMRVSDVLRAGSMAMCALALTLGAAVSGIGLQYTLHLGMGFGWLGLLLGGVFVGMLASALTEALEVIPVIYVRLRIASDLRYAAVALMLGKGVGALLSAWL